MSEALIVGLSGGVDSAVSALLLQQGGAQVAGLFMQNWSEDEPGWCTAAEDFQQARAVAAELGIVLHRADFSARYRERVFADFLAALRAGRTPNPDVACNREIKFGPFLEHARRLGAERVATGHYARLRWTDDGPELLRAVDEGKDQTYFLCQVPRAALTRVEFPIGALRKDQVRALARDAGLPNHERPDSTGICFIGEFDFSAFIARFLPDRPGPITDEHGRVLGTHRGLHHYTLGQRRGLGIGGRRGAREAPWYVVARDLPENRLVVSQDPQHPLLMCTELVAGPFNWLGSPGGEQVVARIRHRQRLQAARLIDGGTMVTVRFQTPQRAAMPGQFLALYDGQRCLGGGEIRRVHTLGQVTIGEGDLAED